jgi:flagellar hook-associated protein 1 FlgK
MAAKQQVQFAGSDLAKKVRNSFENLDSQANSQEKLIERTLTDIQALADKVAELNINIKKDMAAGGSPNDMMDKRDEALSELSKLINIHTSQAPDGTLSVFMGSFALVDQVGSRPFPTTYDAATSTVSKDGLTWPITGGKLKGLFENVTQLNSFKGTMDTFANQLRNLVNTIHEGGISNGATGRNFFNDSSPQTGARDFDLDPGILTNASLIATGTTSAKGDGSIALALSDLRNSTQAGLGNQTIGNFFSSFLISSTSAVFFNSEFNSAICLFNCVAVSIVPAKPSIWILNPITFSAMIILLLRHLQLLHNLHHRNEYLHLYQWLSRL